MTIACRRAEARRLTYLHCRHVGDPNDQAVAIGYRRLGEVFNRLGQRIGAHYEAFTTALDEARTGLHVRALQRSDQIAKAESMGSESGWVRPRSEEHTSELQSRGHLVR